MADGLSEQFGFVPVAVQFAPEMNASFRNGKCNVILQFCPKRLYDQIPFSFQVSFQLLKMFVKSFRRQQAFGDPLRVIRRMEDGVASMFRY